MAKENSTETVKLTPTTKRRLDKLKQIYGTHEAAVKALLNSYDEKVKE